MNITNYVYIIRLLFVILSYSFVNVFDILKISIFIWLIPYKYRDLIFKNCLS